MAEKIALNKVEGFDPADYARTIKDTNGQDAMYLDVQYRKLWFRLCNPAGKIVQKIHTFDGTLAVVEARIYLDRNDPEDAFISNAFAQRFAGQNDQDYGNRYLETAATAAVGRALADAGYGLQFCLDRDKKPVDSLQQVQKPRIDQIIDDSDTQSQSNQTQQPVQSQSVQPQAEANRQKSSQADYVQYPEYVGRSVEDIMNAMSYNEATKYIYRTRNKGGKHDGETLGYIASYAFKDIEWIVLKYAGTNNVMKAAACIIYNAHMQQIAQ